MAWRTLRGCSAMQANLYVGFLEEAGIPARFVDGSGNQGQRDFVAPTDDPVIVEVRDADHEAAHAVLAREFPETPVAARRELLPPEAAAFRAAESSGRRIRWTCLTPFAPIGVWEAPTYLRHVREAGSLPTQHTWNLVGIGFAVVATCLYSTWALGRLLG